MCSERRTDPLWRVTVQKRCDELYDIAEGPSPRLRRTITWGQGAAMAQHALLPVDTGIDIYVCALSLGA